MVKARSKFLLFRLPIKKPVERDKLSATRWLLEKDAWMLRKGTEQNGWKEKALCIQNWKIKTPKIELKIKWWLGLVLKRFMMKQIDKATGS